MFNFNLILISFKYCLISSLPVINAKITVQYPIGCSEKECIRGRELAIEWIEGFCKLLRMDVSHSDFRVHTDDPLALEGYQEGIEFEVLKDLAQVQNRYNMSKIFEGLSGVLGSIHPVIGQARFQLLA